MTTKTEDRPVLKAIATIMKEVGAVEKKGRNDFHRYDYAKAEDVAAALQKRMADAGLIIIPNQTKFELIGNDNLLAIEFEFLVEHVSGDKLDERPKFTGVASAKNSKGGFDDKAANKCLTAASKYFTLQLFKIPTGDYHDADGDEERPMDKGRPPARQQQPDPSPFDDQPSGAETYVNACLAIIREERDADALKQWWNDQKGKRREHQLSPQQVETLKDAVVTRLNLLTNPPTEYLMAG